MTPNSVILLSFSCHGYKMLLEMSPHAICAFYAFALQEADLQRRARHQDKMRDEYARLKNKLKNMDIELHTEVCFASRRACSASDVLAPSDCFAAA